MKKLSLYIFLVLITCSFANAGWFSKELYLNCFFTEESGNDYMMIDISKGKFCVSDSKGQDARCGEVAQFNSDYVKTTILDPKSSATASMFGQKIYWMVNRKTGIAGIYSAVGNKLLSEKLICKTREKL